jgi:hypothetical protein
VPPMYIVERAAPPAAAGSPGGSSQHASPARIPVDGNARSSASPAMDRKRSASTSDVGLPLPAPPSEHETMGFALLVLRTAAHGASRSIHRVAGTY